MKTISNCLDFSVMGQKHLLRNEMLYSGCFKSKLNLKIWLSCFSNSFMSIRNSLNSSYSVTFGRGTELKSDV